MRQRKRSEVMLIRDRVSSRQRSRLSLQVCLVVFGMIPASFAGGQGTSAKPASPPAVPKTETVTDTATNAYRTTTLTTSARNHYQLFWGIDLPEVKAVESGLMIRFSYMVTDAAKAAPLNDKKAVPKLMDPEARVSLEVPSVDQVGQLRQSSAPQTGRAYWMIFSNKHREVKPGDRVSIVIGRFRADGLYVQ